MQKLLAPYLDDAARDAFFSQYISDLPKSIVGIEFYNPIEWPDSLSTYFDGEDLLSIGWVDSYTDEIYRSIEIHFTFPLDEDWPYSFSPQEYIGDFIKQIDVLSAPRGLETNVFTDSWKDRTTVQVHILLTNTNSTLGEQIIIGLEVLVESHKLAIKHLATPDENESVTITLDIPNELKVYCEQYLVYFVQFLRDLGVEASSELKHDAGQVLFSVTPANKDEALDKIRTALEVYLCLPSGKLAVAGNEPIEIQRLSANILHLQSQLMLAQATIQHKDAAIQLQQATIQHQKLLLAENVIIQSVVDITPQKAEDKEEFLGGAVALTQIEKSGVIINLAEIYRRLRDLFKK